MASGEVVNISEIPSEVLWPLVLDALSPLITLVKIAGAVLLVYIAYIIIKGILTYKRNKKIDITYEKVLEIDKKLDELLRTAKKEKVSGKQEKKKGFFGRLFGRKEKKVKEKK